MSVYNGEAHLREAIDSILNQSFTDFEFIIVDDCSTDASLEIIRSFEDIRIKIINNEKNIGLTKSLNIALKQAGGKYIARQDSDDISLQHRLKKQLDYLEKHPGVVLLGTSIFAIDSNGRISEKRIAAPNPGKTLFEGNKFVHGSVMFKKDLLKEVGYYNELFKYSQDYELWLRIAEHYDARNLTEPLYKLRVHSGSIGASKIGEQSMFVILAQKMRKSGLNKKELEFIKKGEFENIYQGLSKYEKIRYHDIAAYNHIQNNNLEMAKKDFMEIFKLNPFCFRNNVNLFMLFSGQGGILIFQNIYRYLRFLLYRVFKLKI